MAVTSLGTVTSALIATASPPAAVMVATTSSAWGALARWLTTTRYPCSARTNAVAAPMPRLAPVITATRAIRSPQLRAGLYSDLGATSAAGMSHAMRDIQLPATKTLLDAYSFRSRSRSSELRRSWRPSPEGISELVAFLASKRAAPIHWSEHVIDLGTIPTG